MSIGTHILRYYILLFMLPVMVEVCLGYTFDQVLTGVYFSPFVKLPYPNEEAAPDTGNYTTNENTVMLEVILENFSKVTTWGVGFSDEQYMRNVTYYHTPTVEVYISEMAAVINRRLGKKRITIMQGIRHYVDDVQMETAVRLAMECAEKANNIFPGTVEGLEFTDTFTDTNVAGAEKVLEYLKELKRSVKNLKLGTTMDYSLLYSYKCNESSQNEMKIVRDIFRESNYVVYSMSPSEDDRKEGPEVAFESISELFLEFRKEIRKNYSKDEFEVIGHLQWYSDGNNKWETLKNMKTYWEHCAQWAIKYSFPIRFSDAFDNPVYPGLAHTGWWRLTDNLKSGQRAGYIEKILELNESSTTTPESTTISAAGIVGVTLGLFGLCLLVSFIAILHLRVRKLQQKLSKEDIKQFINGMSDTTAAQQDAQNLDISALICPYEISFEIQKDQLKIQHDKILGIGEFGCVFKATIESPPDGCKHVALKMAKDGCSRNVLKGFLSEIKILIYVNKHPNIISIIGAYTAELHRGIVYIATELCILGSLQGYLRKHEKPTRLANDSNDDVDQSEATDPVYIDDLEPVTFSQMLQWSQQIASGMEYLGIKNVVHADLATRNVLLSIEKVAKISDFGLSRRMYNYTNYIKSEQEPMPWRWMAIESLKRCEFSAKSDVWSFGVTMWEIFSMGDIPYPGIFWTTGFVNMLVDGLRLERPSYATPILFELMVSCWNMEMKERPSFTDILTVIQDATAQTDRTNDSAILRVRN